MSIRDDTVKNGTLDATLAYFDGLGSLEYALLTGDPDAGGVEMDSVGGYAPATWDLTAWINPTTGTIATTTDPVSFGTSTDAWTAGGDSTPATWWLLRVVGGVDVYAAPLSSEINVAGAGRSVAFFPSIPIN